MLAQHPLPIRGTVSGIDHVHVDGSCPRICSGVLSGHSHESYGLADISVFDKSDNDKKRKQDKKDGMEKCKSATVRMMQGEVEGRGRKKFSLKPTEPFL